MKQTHLLKSVILALSLCWNYAIAQPNISSFSPHSGIPGSSITITGTNFSDTAANDIVFFGAAIGTTTSASPTSLTVTVPTGATYSQICVLNFATGLVRYSEHPFMPEYNNAAYVAATINFDAPANSSTGNYPYQVTVGDLDGDGRPDIAVTNYYDNNVLVFMNTSTPGSVSFGALATLTTGATSVGQVAIGDLDGDGKPEIVIPCISSSGNGEVIVYRNTSVPGTISFAAAATFNTAAYPNDAVIVDLNYDGKPDIATSNPISGNISVLKNTGSVGTLSFAAHAEFAIGGHPSQLVAGDVDGDSKPDLVLANSTDSNIAVLRNTTTASGSITFGTVIKKQTPYTPNAVRLCDLDGDDKFEILTDGGPGSGGTFSVFPNNSSSGSITLGTRLDFATGGTPWRIDAGDFDGDGKPDVAVASTYTGKAEVFRNTSAGTGSFTFMANTNFAANVNPDGIVVADIDGDGKPDIVTSNEGANSISVLRNDPLQHIGGGTGICAGLATAVTDATPGGTWVSSNTGIATVGSLTGTVTGVSAGTATISYVGTAATAAANNAATIAVTVNPGVLPAAIGGTAQVCIGSTTDLTDATGGGTWSSSNGTLATAGSTGIVSGIGAGVSTISYTLTATGCYITQVVTVNAIPAVSAPSATICNGSSTALSASGAAAYSWSPATGLSATTGADPTANPTVTTTYTITGTTYGCSSIATTTVSVNPLPGLVSVSGNGSAFCTSWLLIAIDGTGGSIYYEDTTSGGTSIAAHTVHSEIYATGTYYFRARSAAGCWGPQGSSSVTINPAPAAISGTGQACTGATTALTDSTGGGAWSSSNTTLATAGSTGIVSGIAAGVSTISYTLATGCYATQKVTVNITPTVSASSAGICPSTPTALSATGADSYTWSPATGLSATTGASPAANLTVAVIYTVTGTTNGCSASTTTTVTVNPLPGAVTVSGGGIFCGDAPILATGGSGGTIYFEYTTSGGTAITANSNEEAVSASGIYYFRAKSAAGCWGTQGSVTVTVNALPTMYSVSGGGNYCVASSGHDTVISITNIWLSGSNTGITYKLYCGSTQVGAAIDGTGGGLDFGLFTTVGTYTVYGYNTVTGCTTGMSGSATVSYGLMPTISGPTSVDGGSSITLTGVPSGGTWSSLESACTVSDAGVVTCRAGYNGDDYIYYSLDGCSAMQNVTLIWVGDRGSAPVQPTLTNSKLHIAPNPNNGTFSVKGEWDAKKDAAAYLEVTDAMGRTVLSREISISNGEVDEQVQMNNAASGVYIVSLRSGSDKQVFHITVEQ